MVKFYHIIRLKLSPMYYNADITTVEHILTAFEGKVVLTSFSYLTVSPRKQEIDYQISIVDWLLISSLVVS